MKAWTVSRSQVCPTRKQCTQKEETQQGDELAQTTQHRLDADKRKQIRQLLLLYVG